MALKTTPVSRPNWNSRHVRWKSLIKVVRNGTFVKTFQSIKGHNLDWNTLARLLWKSFRRHPRFPHERAWNSVNIWLQTTATTDRQTEIYSKLHLPPLCQGAKPIRRSGKQPWNTYLHWCIFLLQATVKFPSRALTWLGATKQSATSAFGTEVKFFRSANWFLQGESRIWNVDDSINYLLTTH